MSKGLAGVKTLTAKQIADKWKLPLVVVAKKIAAGVKVEKEHTTSTRQANEIARDHLGERPDYYDMLHKMEKKKLNELGEYDNKGGTPGYEETTGSIRAVRKRDVKEQSPANPSYTERPIYERGKVPADMSDATARGIYEISAELVGRVSNARFWRGEAPSKTLTRAINKKFIESGKKKEPKKQVKEEDNTKPDINLMGNQKPDAYGYGAKGTTKTIHEETKMDNKELINEALDCILEDNLPEMKDNLMKALQEKAMEKLEERKKEIAAQYFAQ